ncbi:hypothetical protein TorRG33x02_018370 [Trema orientale]|uniref:Uncharacterized protein n=1 Tax=Trema orientale TaxID=63057 RepID=A0A2P5FW77_TREOI|nr:hypothetical protein TorRG33x02_018370 [Trema orientale]
MQSSGSESASPTTHRLQSLSAADTRGKHRIQAELKRLEQETRFLEIGTIRSNWSKDVGIAVDSLDRLQLRYAVLLFFGIFTHDDLLEYLLAVFMIRGAAIIAGLKSLNSLKEWKGPQPHATKLMAPSIHYGIDGLKGLKIQEVADAGSCDDYC